MKRRYLSEKKWAVLEDLFYSDLDENAVLKKHNVQRTTYEKWLREKFFSRQFQEYAASLARRSALAVAKAETDIAARLVELTRCEKDESARKACQDVLAVANRFFETVACINEGTLEGNRGSFGKYRGSFGKYRGSFGKYGGSFGEYRGTFGSNQDAFGTNHDHPDQNHPRPQISPAVASKILAVLAESEDEKN
jgi:hypothetical protein